MGYVRDKVMTPVPALIPYSLSQTLDTKLTLTPTDKIKVAVEYMIARSKTTGSQNTGGDPELGSSGGAVGTGGDPQPLRGAA